jgi:hypothetical protein
MKNDDERRQPKGVFLSRPSTSDLRGRQSVRATFKLTEGCIDAISIVATQLGIKQKSLFDHLVEDAQVLSSIARRIRNIKLHKQNRVQKTYVISRRSLYSLDKVSSNFNAPRDALIEYSVQRLLPIIIKEQERHEKRKQILGEITKHFKDGEKLLNKIRELLGEEDPIYHRLGTVMNLYGNANDNIASVVEKGKIIEDFIPDDLERLLKISRE